jgi:hypothetical protein
VSVMRRDELDAVAMAHRAYCQSVPGMSWTRLADGEYEAIIRAAHRGAVAALARLANPTHRPRSEEAALLQAEVVQIAQATLDALGGQ